MMSALHGTMGTDSIAPDTYRGKKRNLIMYGPGKDWRTAVFHAHRKKGGNVITWDLGYWDRDSCLRMSINNFHPTAKQLAYSEAAYGHQRLDINSEKTATRTARYF